MDEDQILESIIADPDLVDPSIDVSKLRQTTPTSSRLLGNVSGIEGLRFDPTRTDYIRDLYSVYSGGLPTIDVAPEVVAPVVDTTTPVVDTSSMDQVTGGGETTPTNTDFEQGLIDQGIGVQGAIGDPVVAPGEIPVTQEEIDAFNAPAVLDSTSTADEIMQDLNNQQAMLNPTGGNIMDEVALTGGVPDTNITAPSGDVFAAGDPLAEEKIDFDAPATELGSQINSAFENVKDRGVSAVTDFKDALVGLGGKVKEGFNNIVDFGGTQIDIGKTLATGAINYIGKSIFGPVGAVLGTALGALGLEGGRGDVSDALAEKYGRDDIGRLTGGPMAGYSVGPNHAQTVQDRIDSIKNRTAPQTKASEEKIAELEAYKAEVIAIGSSGVVTEPGTVVDPGYFTTQEEIDAFNAPPPGINLVDEVSLTGGDNTPSGPPEGPGITADDAFADDGPSNAGGPPSGPGDTADDGFSEGDGPSNAGGPPSGPGASGSDAGFDNAQAAADAQAAANQDAARGGGGGGTSNTASRGDPATEANRDAARGGGGGGSSGGGKIVCTMMNESYGFGSFRNKIWLKHSKDLAPEYQKGYHKIFLPLVKLSKNNKVLKTMLEHIAVHRTIDIRQESRGKVHLLGRVYRKILEPICYLVGKYVK